MIDFFFKKKKIVLDCFTDKQYVYDYARIDHGNNFLPEWWKKTPKFIKNDIVGTSSSFNSLTIKHCSGLMELYKKSIIIPSWFTLEILISSIKEKKVEHFVSCNDFKTENHGNIQFNNFANNDGGNFKIANPWVLSCSKKIWFSWTQPTWSMRNNMFNMAILPAVLNFYEQHNASINFFYRFTEKRQLVTFEPLQPLVMIHPLTECEIELKHHIVDSQSLLSIVGGYRNLYFSSIFNPIKSKTAETMDDKLKEYNRSKKTRQLIFERTDKRPQNDKRYSNLMEKDNGKSE